MDKSDFLVNNGPFIRFPLVDFIASCREENMSEIDLTLQAPHVYVDSDGYWLPEILKERKRNQISIHCVTPLPYRYTICAGEGTIQYEKSLAYYKQCILLAQEIGAVYLCITGSGACYDYEKSALMDNAENMLIQLAEFAGVRGITLLLGSVLGEECEVNASTPVLVKLSEISDMLRRVRSSYLKAYLDTEVISLCGETISQWFNELGEQICLIRLTDGNYNGYRLWGRGCLPCDRFLAEIWNNNYRGKFSLQIPGERYMEDPVSANKENISYLMSAVAGIMGEKCVTPTAKAKETRHGNN